VHSIGGRRELFARHLLLSRSLSRGCARRTARGKKTTQTEAKECVTRNHRVRCAFIASRALSGHLFSSIIAQRERERENHPSAPEFCSPKEKKGYKKKASKSALASSDANARFQNKRRVVVRKTYHGARLHRDGFADEGGLLDVSGSEHFFCEFFA